MAPRLDDVAGEGAAALHAALVEMLGATNGLPSNDVGRVIEIVGRVLGADSARVLVADYGMLSLQPLGENGPVGARQPIEGTLAGHALVRNDVVLSGDEPTVVCIPLNEGSERLGVLELVHSHWDDDGVRAALDPVIRVLVLVLISKRRYTDAVLRARRSEPLSPAAELQWDLLPPLTCSTEAVSVSGILEPAYSIGGDSFDYAVNADGVEFAIIDAVGHGMPAVLMSTVAINSLRNARREGRGIEVAYHDTDAEIDERFGSSWYVTGQIGSLDVTTGDLRWINAGHPLPLLVRNDHVVELACRPSRPMGLGGPVVEIAIERLQGGDRVLFYTDGVTETRSPDGERFGVPRLADFLVRATNDAVAPAETVRRLSASITGHNGAGLSDDATLLLLSFHGRRGA